MMGPGLLWRTLRYLPLRQLWFLFRNRLPGKAPVRLPATTPLGYFLRVDEADRISTYQYGTFTFLNQSITFPTVIDWNEARFGKLWTYNLTYFDYLNQPGLTPNQGVALINEFIRVIAGIRDGLEPYPTSLRLQNWIQFVSRHQLQDATINSWLWAQTNWLRRHLEYHLGGNHLLENGFALLQAAFYFHDHDLCRQASALIREQLTAQVLADGLHEERSLMYHQGLLHQLLNVVQSVQHSSWQPDLDLPRFLRQKASHMLTGLQAVTFRNGQIPMVNDAACGVAPTTAHLWAKASRILPVMPPVPAWYRLLPGASGYRMFRQQRYELFADVGAIGPNHQPGHAHADSLSFLLHVDNHPIFVDMGVSTYEAGRQRAYERSTAAHNTVAVDGLDSSEVWAVFRVGRRAFTTVLVDTETTLQASHNGYRHRNVLHERTWVLEANRVIITDRLLHAHTKQLAGQTGMARFHPAAGLLPEQVGDTWQIGPITMQWQAENSPVVSLRRGERANGFNQRLETHYLEVAFTNCLKTSIILTDEHTIPNVLF